MKSISHIFFVVLFLLATINVFSQNGNTQAQKMTDKMKIDFVLTDDQAQEVLPVNQSFIESLQALRGSTAGKLAKYRKFKSADDKRDKAMKKILSSEQYALFEKQKQENREQIKEARKNGE